MAYWSRSEASDEARSDLPKLYRTGDIPKTLIEAHLGLWRPLKASMTTQTGNGAKHHSRQTPVARRRSRQAPPERQAPQALRAAGTTRRSRYTRQAPSVAGAKRCRRQAPQAPSAAGAKRCRRQAPQAPRPTCAKRCRRQALQHNSQQGARGPSAHPQGRIYVCLITRWRLRRLATVVLGAIACLGWHRGLQRPTTVCLVWPLEALRGLRRPK